MPGVEGPGNGSIRPGPAVRRVLSVGRPVRPGTANGLAGRAEMENEPGGSAGRTEKAFALAGKTSNHCPNRRSADPAGKPETESAVMENLFFIIIAGVVLFVKIRQSMKTHSENRPGQGRDRGQSESFPPPLPTRRQPGPVLRRAQPQPLRPATSSSGERGLPQLLDELLGVDTLEPAPAEGLPLQPQPALDDGDSGPTLPPLAAPVSSAPLLGQSLTPAFPASAKHGFDRRGGVRQPFRLRVRGKDDLRRAVVLGEVLGRPRAFDV